jgi:hypothetical protein
MASLNPRRAIAVACAALASWLGTAGTIFGQPRPVNEYEVKAAYLYNFGRFVAWPPQSTGGPDFAICVLGTDPFGETLDTTVAGGALGDKPVVVRRLSQYDPAARCHILFISASEEERLDPILSAVGRAPVLTVGDVPDFVEHGGMLGFTIEGNRVRFTINAAATEAAGLTPSSELLRVAGSVVGSGAPRR